MKSIIEAMIKDSLSEAKAEYNNPQVEKRYQELKGKSKSDLVDIYASSHRIIDKSEVGKGNPKSWLVHDILVQEFGNKKVNESLDEANEYDDFVHKNELNKIISSKSAEQLEKDYHHYVVNGGPRSMSSRRLKMVQAALKAVNETKIVSEAARKASDYEIYHKDFSSAVQHAEKQVEKRGYTIDPEEWDRKVAMGPRKPGKGKTNSYTLALFKNGKETRRMLDMQVYYDDDRYELNMYIS